MSSFGKKILSAFVEVKDDKKEEQTIVDEHVAKPSLTENSTTGCRKQTASLASTSTSCLQKPTGLVRTITSSLK